MSLEPDPMAEIRASFFVECEELLEALQDGLQIIENGDEDPETINVVFRAVHSIKGGAGAFGLEGLVRFAHGFEAALDDVRSGNLNIEPEALKVLFRAADHLSDLVRVSRDEGALPDAQTVELLAALDGLVGGSTLLMKNNEPEIDFAPVALSLDLNIGESASEDTANTDAPYDAVGMPALDVAGSDLGPGTGCFTILFTPYPELFDTGNEPAILLRNLAQLGDVSVVCDATGLPELTKLRPDIPHLSWTITLRAGVEEDEIASIFEFVESLCSLEIRREPDGLSQTEASLSPDNESVDVPPFTPQAPDEIVAEADHPAQPDAPLKIPDEPPAKPPTPNGKAVNSVVRVDLDRIERLVNLVGELVINQAMLSQCLETSGLSPHSDTMSGLNEFQRLTRDIQDGVMMIRAQPVKPLFQRMSRIVREASAAVGKDVRLHTIGEATEVDKTVIERLADPLTHMIRNAVDHGLETPEMRAAAGKPAQGRVNLSAAHRSGRVVIEVSDDGAGINRPRVLQIAIDKGLVAPDATLSDSEVDNLLFMPGFSTVDVVSDLSGRGVGMDVVRTAIQSLGGRITITSVPGQGTVFSISLPLTLAVLDGMVIMVAGETLVLPLNLVIETLAVENKNIQIVRPGQHTIQVRNDFVPLLDLGAALGYRAPLHSYEDAVVLLISQEDESATALVIDSIVDQRQVVIKGLDDCCYRAPGIAAATILGDGQIALILDPIDVIKSSAFANGLRPRMRAEEVPA